MTDPCNKARLEYLQWSQLLEELKGELLAMTTAYANVNSILKVSHFLKNLLTV
jgi:hypothetical protein